MPAWFNMAMYAVVGELVGIGSGTEVLLASGLCNSVEPRTRRSWRASTTGRGARGRLRGWRGQQSSERRIPVIG